ncbi:hypothetical protein JCM8547_008050 [Rhodosporidiobolus lusitaniae]
MVVAPSIHSTIAHTPGVLSPGPSGRPDVVSPSVFSDSSPTPGQFPSSSARRSSFSSSESRLARYPSRGKGKGSTLPSIRSLKSKFLGALGGGIGGGERRGPKVVKGEAARKPIRIVSASTIGGGLKGFSGPGGAERPASGGAGISRSVSTPASLHALARPGGDGLRPALTGEEAMALPPPLPASVSVDAMLSSAAEAARSPAQLRTTDSPTPYRHSRAASSPYDPSAVAPHRISSPPPSNCPLPSPSHLPPLPHISFSTPLVADALVPPAPSPTAQPKEPILRPISADFSRPAAAPSLLKLRKQQARESLEVERSASRQSGHRHSRILPGASLPANLVDLQRSKSLGTTASAEDKRGRHWSVQPPRLHPPLPQPERSSWQGQSSQEHESPGETSTNGIGRGEVGVLRQAWMRRHSTDGTMSSPSATGEDSPELEEGEREAHRGRSLSALLGQARNGLGLGGSGGAKEYAERKDRERRPSKPFPGGFEEVPYRPSIDATAFADTVSPTSSSPAAFARPLSLPAIVQQQQRERQYQREQSFPDTPPPSAKLNYRQSDSSLAVSSRRPSIAQPFDPSALPENEAVPPLPPSELTLTLQLQLEANPSHFHSPPERTSSLPELRKSKSAIEVVPSPSPPPSAASPPPLHGVGVIHAASPVYDLTSARASVQITPSPSHSHSRSLSDRRESDSSQYSQTDSHDPSTPARQRVLSMPDGKTFAQVIEERSRGGKPLGSPLAELIEELRSRSNSVANSPTMAKEGEREVSSEEEEEEDVEDVDSPYLGRKDSQTHPFQLAAYLDSPVSSPPVGKRRKSDHIPPPLPTTTSYIPLPIPSLALSPSLSRTPASTPPASSPAVFPGSPPTDPPPALPASSPGAASDLSSSMDRTLTLDQMEREIARMEAELALSGRPHSFYDDSTPRPADVATFSSASPQPPSTSLSAPPPATAATPSFSDLGVSFSGSESEADDLSALPSAPADGAAGGGGAASAPPGSQVTPRTARRWSILEIEKAYDRMKRLLGSSASSFAGTPSAATGGFSESGGGVGGRAYATDDIAEREEESQGEEQGVKSPEQETDVESALDEALAQARAFTGRQEGESSSEAPSPASANLDLKPLPHLPPPTPSPNADRLAASASTVDSHGQQQLPNGDSTPPTSHPSSTSTVSLKASLDSLAPPTPLNTRDPSRLRQLAPSPSFDSLRLASSSGHKRRTSDASSTGGIRKLVLPASNHSRLRTRATTDSLRSIHAEEDRLSEAGGVSSPPRRSSTPVSPGRRTPAQRASSRLSLSGALRSGAGRELQRRVTEDLEEEDPLFSTSSAGRRERERARSSLPNAQRNPPSISASTLVEARRRSAGVSASSSWYPVTPNRPSPSSSALGLGLNGASARRRTDSSSTVESLSYVRRSSAEDAGDEAGSLTSGGGLEESEMMTNASLNMASIRQMDKLEIFFKYTSVRADLEKAELERDALLDALRETRSTLSDVRRQRDSLDAEVKREKVFSRQVKKSLGNDPERYADKLSNLVESRQAWEDRAREALDELERAKEELEAVRREMVDGKEREERLERENVIMGARLTAFEMTRSEYSSSPTMRFNASTPAAAESPVPSGLPLPSNRNTPTPRRSVPHSSNSTTSSIYDNGSPTLTHSRPVSQPPPPHSTGTTPPSSLKRRSEPDLLGSRKRHASKDSLASTSTTSGLKANLSGLGDLGSPLMGQTMSFGPKSSYGSNASPLKARSGASPASLVPPHRGQFSSLRIPSPNNGVRRLSKHSTASSGNEDDDEDESDFADQSFESEQSGMVSRLKRKDEAFLADLTEEFSSPAPPAPTAASERRSSAEE